jgi:hypothetical protein
VSDLERRHLRAGWWGLAIFVVLGAVLEGLHALKSPIFVDAGRETTRMMLRLAHSHGTLVAVVNILYALTLRARPEADRPLASASLLAAFFAHGGDPGLGIILVPVGALAVTLGAGVVARAMKS